MGPRSGLRTALRETGQADTDHDMKPRAGQHLPLGGSTPLASDAPCGCTPQAGRKEMATAQSTWIPVQVNRGQPTAKSWSTSLVPTVHQRASLTRSALLTTLYANNADKGSSRAFTWGLIRNRLGSVIRFAVGINEFPVLSPQIGFRPLHEPRHASGQPRTHACPPSSGLAAEFRGGERRAYLMSRKSDCLPFHIVCLPSFCTPMYSACRL